MRDTLKNCFGIIAAGTLVLTGCSKSETETGTASPSTPSPETVEAQPSEAPPPPVPGEAPQASAAQASGPIPMEGSYDPNKPISVNNMPPYHVKGLGKDGAPDLEALSQAIRDWAYYIERLPSSVDELVTTRFVTSIPAPPEGKKYVINARTAKVELANK